MATVQKRTGKKGVSWRAQVRIKGRCETATFDTKAQAYAWAEEIENRLRAGQPLPGEVPTHARPLADAIREYLEHIERSHLKEATTRMYTQCADRISAAFPDHSLEQLSRQEIVAYRDARLEKVGSATVLHDLSFLRQLYKYVRLHWGYDLPCPVDGVPTPRQPKHREPLLSQEQLGKLLDTCRASLSPTIYYYVLTLLHTAMRPSEAAALRWEQVRMDDNLILLSATKTGKTRSIPMVKRLRSVMRLLSWKNPGEYVFLPAGTQLRRIPSEYFRPTFQRICQRANLPGITLYSLRHLAASYMVMNGVDIRTVADIMGHSNISMTMRYTHLANAHKLKALDRLRFADE